MQNIIASIALLSVALLSSCTSSETKEGQFEFTGTVQQPEMTTYQYGTHSIEEGTTFYALKSKTVDLNEYKGQKVTVVGKKVEGYPIEGGPELIEVSKVKK